MNFFKSVTGSVTKAVDYVVEKNRKAALVNRIRIVIKNERESEARAYVALGKYYFENLRDAQNEETEALCKAVELSDQRMKKAFLKLDEITATGEDEDACADCHDDCDYCPCYDENDVGGESMEDDDFVADSSIVDKANTSSDTAEEAAEEAADDVAENPQE